MAASRKNGLILQVYLRIFCKGRSTRRDIDRALARVHVVYDNKMSFLASSELHKSRVAITKRVRDALKKLSGSQTILGNQHNSRRQYNRCHPTDMLQGLSRLVPPMPQINANEAATVPSESGTIGTDCHNLGNWDESLWQPQNCAVEL